jgi:hypothetical protein
MKKNELLSFSSICMEWENIILNEVSQARWPKIIRYLSYADFRSREKTVMLLDLGHMLRAELIWEVWG